MVYADGTAPRQGTRPGVSYSGIERNIARCGMTLFPPGSFKPNQARLDYMDDSTSPNLAYWKHTKTSVKDNTFDQIQQFRHPMQCMFQR